MAFLVEVRIPVNPPIQDDVDITSFYFTENSRWSFQDFRSKVKKLPCFSQMPAIRSHKNMKNVWHRQLTRLRETGTEEQKKLANTLRTSPQKQRRKRTKPSAQQNNIVPPNLSLPSQALSRLQTNQEYILTLVEEQRKLLVEYRDRITKLENALYHLPLVPTSDSETEIDPS